MTVLGISRKSILRATMDPPLSLKIIIVNPSQPHANSLLKAKGVMMGILLLILLTRGCYTMSMDSRP